MIAAILFAMAVTTTDQTVNVSKGTKLDVNNFAGDVVIKVWDKDAVRVEVNHSDREVVDIKPGEQTLSIRSRSVRGGPPRSLDYTITVPGWMGGLETLQALRLLDRGLPAVVSSGFSSDPIMASHAEHGFAAVLAKPYEPAQLREVVARVLASPGTRGAGPPAS